jgi:hypothetical protein
MSLPIQTDESTDLPYDAQVAAAMNRVLAAEQAARAEIADCGQQMQAALEHARQQRRTILERSRARITALHVRAAHALGERTALALEQRAESLGPPVAQGDVSEHLQAALQALAEHLTQPTDEVL